jgi:predicted RNase H-like HicB family nuclease
MSGHIALVHKDVGMSHGVSFPDVLGCISAGDTFDEALVDAATEALGGHLALMQADGDTVPSPRSFENHEADREFADGSAGAIVTVVAPQVMAAVG